MSSDSGKDGFTAEFYVQFFELLAPDLPAAYLLGEMSISRRRGVITLIPKDDSDLLNVDYKIASKAIALH